jgi:hypothetical protein
MKTQTAKKHVDSKLSRRSHMRISRVAADTFTQRRVYKFKLVLEEMKKNPKESLSITCDSEDMAKRLQVGFHCSGTGRTLKKQGWKLQTSCTKNVLQVKLTPPSAEAA